jgi:hypothetical protein
MKARANILLGAVAAVAIAGTALSPIVHGTRAASSSASIANVTIAAKDFTLTAPAHIPAGYVRFSLSGGTNPQGTTAIVAALNAGVTQSQVAAALKKGDLGPIVQILTPLGGPAGITSAVDTLKLKAGSYVVFDVEQGQTGGSKAIYKFFSVVPSTGTPSEPASTATVNEKDFKFLLPATVPAGDVTFKIVNTGKSLHETILAKLHAGVTLKALEAYLKQQNPSGPPPVDFLGVASVMAPGHTQFASIALTSGNYVLICFMPDKHGLPHVADGMIKEFTVR